MYIYITHGMGLTAQGYTQGFVSQLVKISGCYRAVIKNVISWASLVTQMVKNLPTVQETWVISLGRGDPL